MCFFTKESMYNTAMAQEEQRCSNSSSGGGGGGSRSSKKAKQKKIPQRGLGVAQLEKMRMEEQQKKATSACIVLPLPQQHHQQASIPFPLPQHHHQQPSNPFPLPPLSTDLSPIFTSSMPVSGLDLYSPAPPTPPPFPHDVNAHLSFPPMWSSTDFSHDGLHEGRRMEPMFPFRPPPLLHNDPNSFWRSSMQRKQNQQHLPQPSSMLQVNVSSSPPSSSGVNNLQMEPPSNQSYCSNSMPPWPEEERMVGMKRPWPFSVDDTFQFHCKFPPLDPSYRRWDESPCGNDVFNMGLREGFSSSNNTIRATDDMNLNKTDGRFLSLGPPAASPNLKSKQPISVPSTHHSEFDLIPFQGSMEYPYMQQQPFYSFLPMRPSSHQTASSDGRVEGADGSVDLNLKL